MKYSTGGMKRVFAVTFEHGDLLIDSLKEFVKAQDIRNGYIFFLGALKEGRLVSGPKNLELPAEPMWSEFGDGREVIGMGSIARDGDTPRVHVHLNAGRAGDSLLGCLREGGRVHIVIEAVLFETVFDSLTRAFDARVGAYLPSHEE
ncbi:MAG: DUF296 domain-containing protein [bacterium]